MSVDQTDHIKTRADGSIDIGFYTQRGRILRSRAAHDMMAPKAAPKRKRVHPSWFWRICRRYSAT